MRGGFFLNKKAISKSVWGVGSGGRSLIIKCNQDGGGGGKGKGRKDC